MSPLGYELTGNQVLPYGITYRFHTLHVIEPGALSQDSTRPGESASRRP